jgi:GT2 family glycosyltransferase
LKNISVIVPTKDRFNDLRRFLQSLDNQTLFPDELVIVDASSDNNTYEFIKIKRKASAYPIKYIKTNPGTSRQRNIGVKASTGKYLFFFDDDIVLETKFLEVVHQTFAAYKAQNVVGIAGRMTNISRTHSLIDRIFKKLFFLNEQGNGRLKLSGFPAHKFDNKLAFVNVLPGGCTAFASQVFSSYCFDENLKGYSYMEDIDFSYRVSQRFNLLYQPKARCKHFASTYRTADSRQLRRMLARHHLYLFKKNLPKDLAHIFAFAMSFMGLLAYNALLLKDFKACVGILEGILTPIYLSPQDNKIKE